MNLLLLYLIFVKASLTSFSGLAGLPILRDELVVKHHVLTDRDLNTALVVGRSTPGPKGLYVVSLGHYVAGFPGACMAWLALLTPALLVVPLMTLAQRYVRDPRFQRVLRTVVLATAGVSFSATVPLAQSSLTNPLLWALALGSVVLLLRTKLDATLVMLFAGIVNFLLLELRMGI